MKDPNEIYVYLHKVMFHETFEEYGIRKILEEI